MLHFLPAGRSAFDCDLHRSSVPADSPTPDGAVIVHGFLVAERLEKLMQFSHEHIFGAPVDDLRLNLERNDWGRFHLAIWGVVFALPGEPDALGPVILERFVDRRQKKHFFRVFELVDHVGDVPNWRFLVVAEADHVARAVQAVKHGFNR